VRIVTAGPRAGKVASARAKEASFHSNAKPFSVEALLTSETRHIRSPNEEWVESTLGHGEVSLLTNPQVHSRRH
jgi:hypothetical protein